MSKGSEIIIELLEGDGNQTNMFISECPSGFGGRETILHL